MGPHRSRPLLVTALKAALLLGAATTPWIAPAAFAETPAERLAGMEAEYGQIMQEAGQLGTGRTIEESIRFSTNRQGQTRVDMERLEEAIKRQGGTVQELTAARDRFKDETVLGPREVGKEVAEEAATNLATRGFSVVFQRVVGVATLIGDVVEYGGKKYIKSLNIDDMNALIAQGRLQQSQLLEMYSVLNKQLIDEIRAQARLRELSARRRQLFEKIARERQRQGLGPGRQDAVLRRDTDAAGDRALEAEAARERLNNGVRLSNPAEAARRKAELDRGGRGVEPTSYAPGFGTQGLRVTGTVTIGYNYSDLPTSTGIGFQRPSGGDETFASRRHDDLELMAFALIFFGDLGEDWVLTTAMQYAWGDEEDEGFDDAPGLDTGFVYGDFSPGGSTGLNIGNRRLDWRTGVDVSSVNVEAKVTRRADGPATWFAYADARHIQRDYDASAQGEVTFSGYPGSVTYTLTQDRRQEVTDSLFGVGAGVQFGGPVTPWLNVGGWTSAGVFYRRSELDSRERNVCGLCGEIPLGDRVSIGLGVDASYIDAVGAVYNPSSGDDLFIDGKHTALTTDSLLTWGVRAGIKFRF